MHGLFAIRTGPTRRGDGLHGADLRGFLKGRRLPGREAALLLAVFVAVHSADCVPARAQALPNADSAAADTAAPDPSAAAPVPGRPGAPTGFVGSVTRWVDEYLAVMNSGLKGARDQFETLGEQARGMAKDARDVAKDVARLPATTLVTGRERCDTAPNGAPDCRAASDVLCRGKGFAYGRSVDVQLGQKCPTQAWFAGRAPRSEECKTESYVTRAACQ